MVLAGRGSRESLLEMGRALASAGTAVIIYDTRKAGYSVLARDYAALAEDAIRAADLLAITPGATEIGSESWVSAKAAGSL
jgi:hypothetical protein